VTLAVSHLFFGTGAWAGCSGLGSSCDDGARLMESHAQCKSVRAGDATTALRHSRASIAGIMATTGLEVTTMRIAGREIDLEELAAICRRYGIAEEAVRLSVFGSVARGEERSDSDVDLFYVLAPGARLGWEIADLNDELRELFGRPVDLGSKRSLHRLVRDEVLSEAKVIYAEAA
jgi:predicted nucleotidyltransferase